MNQDEAETGNDSPKMRSSQVKAPEAPQRIGPYKLTHLLGQGGMGAVYLAERDDNELRMKVAIKLMRRQLADADALALFRHERQRLADLRHPNICVLYDAGTTADGLLYFIMEYIDGDTISEWCQTYKPDLSQILYYFTSLLKALSYAHHQGIIHRDIKPGNIMITHDSEVKLLDFGIAVSQDAQSQTPVFTTAYAAPEQKVGFQIDQRADIYAACLTLLEMLCGQSISALNIPTKQVISQLLSPDHPYPSAVKDLPESLGYVLRKGLQSAKQKRYQTCDALLADVVKVQQSLPRSASQVDVEAHTEYDLALWFHPAHQAQVKALFKDWIAQQSQSIWPSPQALEAPITAHDMQRAIHKARTCALIIGPQLEQLPTLNLPYEFRELIAYRQACNLLEVVSMLLAESAYPQRHSELPEFLRGKAFLRLPAASKPDAISQIDQLLQVHLQTTTATATVESGTCPFRGLEAFREQDRELFFGRTAMVQRIMAQLKQRSFLAVLGPSGSGKSSLIQAGVVPELRPATIVKVRPGKDFFGELGVALQLVLQQSVEQIQKRLQSSPQAFYHMALEILGHTEMQQNLVFIIDQFEEVFTIVEDQNIQKNIVQSLCYLIEHPNPRISLILTMRSDFLGRCANFETFNLHIQENLIQVSPLSQSEMVQVILEPCRVAGLQLEKGLLHQIIGDMQGAGGKLPLLEYALLELYNLRERGTLTLLAYRQIGGLQGALAQRAESEYERLTPDQQHILRKIFVLCLIAAGDGSEPTRRRATWDECIAVTSKTGLAKALLENWLQARLLVGAEDERSGKRIVDVAHEALIRSWHRIDEWLIEDREMARQLQALRRAAEAWMKSGRDPDLLWRGLPLERMETLLSQSDAGTSELERDFITAGVAAREAEARAKEAQNQAKIAAARNRVRWILVVAVAFVLMASLFIYNLRQTVNQLDQANRELDQQISEVRQQRAVADHQREVAEAVTQFQLDMFANASPDDRDPAEISVKELLDKAREVAESSLAALPEVRARLLLSLGRIYSDFGQYSLAESLITKAIESLPGDEQDTLAFSGFLQSLALALKDAEKFEEAACFLYQVVDLREKAGDKLALAETRVYVSVLSYINGDYDDAELQINKALMTFESEESALAQKGLSFSLFYFAQLLREHGYSYAAVMCFQEAFLLDEAIYGAGNRQTIASLTALANGYRELGALDLSLSLRREALQREIDVLGEHHPTVGINHNNLAVLYRERQAYEEAIYHFNKALEIQSLTTEEKTHGYAITLSNLSLVYSLQPDFAKAYKGLVEAKEIIIKHLGQDHTHTAIAYNNLADVERKMGDVNQAAKNIDQALKILRTNLDSDHWRIDVAKSVQGAVNAERGLAEKGEAQMIQALNNLLQNRGEHSEYTREAAKRLVEYYQTSNQSQKVNAYLELINPQ